MNLKSRQFWWEVIKGLAIAAAATFSYFANQTSQKAKDAVDLARADAKFAAEQAVQQRQFDIRAYELVEKALTESASGRKGHGVAAAAIVNALTRPPLRDDLHNALRVGIKDDQDLARMLDAVRKFDLEEQSPARPQQGVSLPPRPLGFMDVLVGNAHAQGGTSELRGYRIDLFYCESSNSRLTEARKARAEAALQKLGKAPNVSARVRLLPILVQARPGYQSYSDEIRFESGERQAATQLATVIGVKSEFVNQIDYKTPNYLSVFYCAEPR